MAINVVMFVPEYLDKDLTTMRSGEHHIERRMFDYAQRNNLEVQQVSKMEFDGGIVIIGNKAELKQHEQGVGTFVKLFLDAYDNWEAINGELGTKFNSKPSFRPGDEKFYTINILTFFFKEYGIRSRKITGGAGAELGIEAMSVRIPPATVGKIFKSQGDITYASSKNKLAAIGGGTGGKTPAFVINKITK